MIRAARRGDAEGIASIWNEIIRNTAITFTPDEKTLAEIEVRIDAGRTLVLDSGGVLGFATFGPFRQGRGYAHSVEHTLHLAAEARGRGQGRALLEAVERHAAGQGAHLIIAGVSSANPGGRAFHLACGYIESGVIAQAGRKFDRWHDLHLLSKLLK